MEKENVLLQRVERLRENIGHVVFVRTILKDGKFMWRHF
jgi:hypothetical protein